VAAKSNEPSSAYGCKGGGESGGIDFITPAAANATYDALGVRIKTLPATGGDKMLKALADKESR